MSTYILDANVFIQAKNISYPFDIFPVFWEWLDQEQVKGRVGSIRSICEELITGNDELADWAKARKDSGWFTNIDDVQTQQCYAQIAEWSVDPLQNFKPSAYQEFLQVGDSWLVAKALATKSVVVTHETYDQKCRSRIKIPNVCKAFGIEYINIIELFRKTGAKFGI